MGHLLTEPHKKELRFSRWPVRRHSELMKCILHYPSAVSWQLSTDKINTDVVKDSAELEWECSPLSICAINVSLCAPLWPIPYKKNLSSFMAVSSSYIEAMWSSIMQLQLAKLYYSCLAVIRPYIWERLRLSVWLNADFPRIKYEIHSLHIMRITLLWRSWKIITFSLENGGMETDG